jgi:molybdopterin-guanine dinucleotide biosynthesis protein A
MSAARGQRPDAGPVTGIVLAGGQSRRFGSDKLVATIDGRTLLERAAAAVAAVATEVVVVVAPDDDRALPEAGVPVRRAVDPEPFGGPLVGLRTGLEVAREPLVVVVGGDMPTVEPAVLALLVRTLAVASTEVACVTLASAGRLVPLPAAVRTGAATDAAARLVVDGERRLRSLFDRLRTEVLEESEWRPLDPGGATLRDVDRPEDL